MHILSGVDYTNKQTHNNNNKNKTQTNKQQQQGIRSFIFAKSCMNVPAGLLNFYCQYNKYFWLHFH